jgi:hypothetical protein
MQQALEAHVFAEFDAAVAAASAFFMHPLAPASLRMHYRRTPKSIVELRLNKPDFAR